MTPALERDWDSAAGGGCVIRPGRRGEMPRIRELIAMFPEDLDQTGLPRIESFFVAEAGGAIVGCCALQVYSRRMGEIRSLAVHPDHGGQGIAAKLVDACRSRARERRVRQLLAVTNEPGFFQKCGFTMHRGWRAALFDDLDPVP